MPHSKKPLALSVDERELATILAALRFHQDEHLQGCRDIADQIIAEIASNSNSLRPLDFDEVATLCERLNTCQETVASHLKDVWVLAITDKGMIVHAWAHNSRSRAEKAMLDYLRSYQEYKGPYNVAQACDWLAKQQGTLRVDICSTQVDISDGSPPLGLTIDPPPEDSGDKPLFRVVYVIDVNAANAHIAATCIYDVMIDPDSMALALQVIDHSGKVMTVDQSEI